MITIREPADTECMCATDEHCPLHFCAKHDGEPTPCFVCGFNDNQKALGAGYRAAKTWKACAKKWRRIVKQVDAECAAAHEAELVAQRKLVYYGGWDIRMSELEELARAARAAYEAHNRGWGGDHAKAMTAIGIALAKLDQ